MTDSTYETIEFTGPFTTCRFTEVRKPAAMGCACFAHDAPEDSGVSRRRMNPVGRRRVGRSAVLAKSHRSTGARPAGAGQRRTASGGGKRLGRNALFAVVRSSPTRLRANKTGRGCTRTRGLRSKSRKNKEQGTGNKESRCRHRSCDGLFLRRSMFSVRRSPCSSLHLLIPSSHHLFTSSSPSSSSAFLIAARNFPPSAPSITRWSAASVTVIIGRTWMPPSRTTAFSWILPMPRMQD